MPSRRRGRRRTRGRRGGTGRVARAGQGSTRGNPPGRRAVSTSIAAETGLRRSARLYLRSSAAEAGAAVEPEDSGFPSAEDQFPGDEIRSRGREAEMARRTQRERTRRDQAAAREEREQTPARTSRVINRGPPSTGTSLSGDPFRPDGGPADHVPSMDVEMEIMSQPPAECGRHEILYPPLTVRLRLRDADADTNITSAGDPSQLWAVVTLMNEHGTQSLAPPRHDLLMGTVTASPRPLARSDPSDTDESESESFVMFPDLAIRESGRYRLRVTLIQMHSDALFGSFGPPGGPIGGPLGGSSMQEVQTGTIQISDHPQRSELSKLTTLRAHVFRRTPALTRSTDHIPFFLEVLRRRGVVVPSPSH